MTQTPATTADGQISIGIGIVLSIFTCGLYAIYWQYRQMQTLNGWLGRKEYSFLLWFVLSILTCGIYGIYYEYKMSKGINEIQENEGLHVNNDLAVLSIVLSILGLGLVSIAIQQADINRFYGG